jgi:hypothetical protein
MVDVGDFYKLNKSNGFRNLSPAIATAYHWVGCRTCTYPARGTRRQQPGTGTPCLCRRAAAGGCLLRSCCSDPAAGEDFTGADVVAGAGAWLIRRVTIAIYHGPI